MTHPLVEEYVDWRRLPPSATSSVESDAARQAKPKSPDRVLPMVWFNEIQPDLETADFVEGVMTTGAMSVTYGASNCGKTFFMTDLCLHIAMNRRWWGREVDQGGVIYCSLEGKHGIGNRIAALKRHYGLEDIDVPLAVVPSAVNMLDPNADTDRLIAAITEAAKTISMPVSLVVIDTLSRAMSGGNENSSDDMGALICNTDRVREVTGAHVNYVHHSGKDVAKGSRGHSSLVAATDTEIEVARADKDSPSVAKVTKQRDLPIEGEWAFNLLPIELGKNRRGKQVNSCVIVPVETPDIKITAKGKLSDKEQLGISMLRRALSKHAEMLPSASDYPTNTLGVAESEWRKEFYAGYPGEKIDTKRTQFNRAKKALLCNGIVQAFEELVWFRSRSDE